MAKKIITGLVLRNHAVEWSSLRARQADRLELLQHDTAELDVAEDTLDLNAPETAAAIKSACRPVKGSLILALPGNRVLLRVVDLPSADPEELDGMVELQVDKFAPFPVDQMAVSWELIEQREDSSRVLLAAAQRDQVEDFGGAFYRAGHTPHEISVSVLGWWHLLVEHGHVAEEGRHVILLMDEDDVELIIAENGQPAIFRSLGGHKDGSASDIATELAEETNYTLTTLEAEWGAATSTRLTVWHWDQEPLLLTSEMAKECGTQAETMELGGLPPLSEGIARRSASPGDISIDLAPTAWHDVEQTRRLRKRLLVTSAAILTVWALVVGGLLIALQVRKNSLSTLAEKVEQLKEPAADVRRMREKVQELEAYGNKKFSSIECLREVSAELPDGLDLTSLAYKKAREVSLRGVTAPNNVNLIYQFFEQLEKSELFVSVSNQRVSTVGIGAKRKAQFSIVAHLPKEKEEEGPP